MAPKRQLRDRGTVEERKQEYRDNKEQAILHSKRTKVDESDSTPKDDNTDGKKRWFVPKAKPLAPIPPSDKELPNEQILSECLGFTEFTSTKGLHVFGNQDGPLPPKRKRRQYRQMLYVKSLYSIPLTRGDQSEPK